MADDEQFSIVGRLASFGYAFAGIAVLLREQHNAWVHLLATAVVVGAGILFHVSMTEWALLVLAITGVWVAEALNTAIELVCDVASPEYHPLVKKAKDVAAGAVLLSATGAAAIGALVFLPYFVGNP
ncbi:MAG: diacylglycerol kinase family protein [Halioglobus sp.]